MEHLRRSQNRPQAPQKERASSRKAENQPQQCDEATKNSQRGSTPDIPRAVAEVFTPRSRKKPRWKRKGQIRNFVFAPASWSEVLAFSFFVAAIANSRFEEGAGFPNKASLLRLISTFFCEISAEWLTAKIYLNMNPANLPLLTGVLLDHSGFSHDVIGPDIVQKHLNDLPL